MSEREDIQEKFSVLALEELTALADAGATDAQYALALRYAFGTVVEPNPELAFAWFKKAAEAGHTAANFELAMRYETGHGTKQNVKLAAKRYLLNAEAGDAKAQATLGKMYLIGKGVPLDIEESVRWYGLAAEQGDAQAQLNLAEMYSMGYAVPQDESRAAGYYLRAAEQGIVEAQLRLAKIYQDGRGIGQDSEKATEWYERATESAMREESAASNSAGEIEYSVRLALPADAEHITEIEIDAGNRFAALNPPYRIVTEKGRSVSTFDSYKLLTLIGKEQVWVVLCSDIPVGFAACSAYENGAVLEEIDVVPAHGRRGLATALISLACGWARNHDLKFMELSTFDAVPWNAPFYQKLGFMILPENEWSSYIHAVRREEEASGLPMEHRVVMRLDL
jgi:GNAT superfamily N-acetyltransferase